MTPRSRFTAYCSDPTCLGWDGVEVLYTGDTWEEPGENVPNECPHCSGPLTDQHELDVENAVADLLEALDAAHLLPSGLKVNELELVRAVITELRRQHKRAKTHELAKTLNTCGRCHGRGEIVVATRGVGGGCVNDDWDVCTACNGTGRPALGRTA